MVLFELSVYQYSCTFLRRGRHQPLTRGRVVSAQLDEAVLRHARCFLHALLLPLPTSVRSVAALITASPCACVSTVLLSDTCFEFDDERRILLLNRSQSL